MNAETIRDRKIVPIHDAIPARLSPANRRGMERIVTEGLAARIAAVSQALNMNPTPAVAYDDLAGPEKARANDAARCAVRWCDPREHDAAELRLRQELTSKLYTHDIVSHPLFHRLTADERAFIAELAAGCLATMETHFNGWSSPVTDAERAELTLEQHGKGAA